MAEIRGTISEERANRIVYHFAEIHRELLAEDGFDAWDAAELGRLVDAAKDAICKRIRAADQGGQD